jgi:RNA polymerase sigma-70 factor (sigma-E family)
VESSRHPDDVFRDLVSSRYSVLLRTAFLLTGDRGHAEDLVQQALLRVYEAVRKEAEPESLEAYTRTAMLRLALRWRQTLWRRERPAEIPDVGAHFDLDLGLQVRQALRALPMDQRAVVVLRYFEGLSEQEAAEALGIAVGTAKSRLSRGIAAMRRSGLIQDPSEDEHATT